MQVCWAVTVVCLQMGARQVAQRKWGHPGRLKKVDWRDKESDLWGAPELDSGVKTEEGFI